MLSTHVIKNSSGAGHYFSQQDNYYSKENGLEHSEWFGRGAEKLGLEGTVQNGLFTDLLNGKLPTGEQIGKFQDGTIKHRAGWDLTFSPPKSVSILALVGEDHRLIEAHREAVRETLLHIEQQCSSARIKKDGKIEYEKTNNLIAALYHHDLSRASDPQVHTHCVVMNETQRSDEKWRSMASSSGRYHEQASHQINGFIEKVRHNNRYFAKVYESELAFRVKNLGYEVTQKTKHGNFEIAGISEALIQAFSIRRDQIEKELAEKGLSGGKAASFATLATREKKTEVNREQLKAEWIERSEKNQVNLKELIEQSLNQKSHSSIEKTEVSPSNTHQPKSVSEVDLQSGPNLEEANAQAQKIIKESYDQISTFQSTFTLEEILESALTRSIESRIPVASVIHAVKAEVKMGNLISVSGENEPTFMSAKNLSDEKTLCEMLLSNHSEKPLISSESLSKYLNKKQESIEVHHDDLKEIFKKDRVIWVQGEDNRKNLMEPIAKIARDYYLSTAVLSPSLLSAKRLSEDLKNQPSGLYEHIKSLFVENTPKHYQVMQFLHQNAETKKPDLILVEKAHLLPTHQKMKLVEWGKNTDTKMIWFGNENQIISQKVGTSLSHLVKYGLNTIHSKESNELALEKLTALKKSGRIAEIEKESDRLNKIAETFVHMKKMTDRPDKIRSAVITVSNKKADQLNHMIHEKLVEKSEILNERSVLTLEPVFVDRSKNTEAGSYKTGQFIRFNKQDKEFNISRGEYAKICNIGESANRLVLEKSNGEKIVWKMDKKASLSNFTEVFNEKIKPIGSGESIIFQRSIKEMNILKGERFIIQSMDKNQCEIKNREGKKFVLDLSNPGNTHFTYAYAHSIHQCAHEKFDMTFSDLPSKSVMTTQRTFNHLVKQSNQVWIYTDNTKKFERAMELRSGNQLTQIEILDKSKKLESSLSWLYEKIESIIQNKLESDANSKSNHGSENIKAASDVSHHKSGADLEKEMKAKATEAVQYAIRHLSEREAGFYHADLVKTALQAAMGEAQPKTINNVLKEMAENNVLLNGNIDGKTLWTSAQAVETERTIAKLSIQDQGKMNALMSAAEFDQFISKSTLTNEQTEAIKQIVLCKDRVVSVEGRAGTGKTTMMLALNTILAAKSELEQLGFNFMAISGVAPTHKAVKELNQRGIVSQTIDRFLGEVKVADKRNEKLNFSKTILIVDEASMASNQKMLEVLTLGHTHEFARIVSVGDTKQNPAIESGKPHDLIQRVVNTVINLGDIQRQKNPTLREAVLSLYEKPSDEGIKNSLAILGDHVLELPKVEKRDEKNKLSREEFIQQEELNHEMRIKQLADDYLEKLSKGENVQIISPSHEDRIDINQLVRDRLTTTGVLAEKESFFSILSPKDMTQIERTKTMNFNLGEIIKFSKSSQKGIQSGDYFTIADMDKKNNSLILKSFTNPESDPITWKLPKQSELNKNNSPIEVYCQQERGLRVGDKIVWTRTNKKIGLVSAEFVKITDISKDKISGQYSDGQSLSFSGSDPKFQHWDHGYALTTYSTQGGTYDSVLALFESKREKLMNLKTYLVTLTRAVHDIKIYTDDRKKIANQFCSNAGDKISALEVIAEYPKAKNRAYFKENEVAQTESISKEKSSDSLEPGRLNQEKIKGGGLENESKKETSTENHPKNPSFKKQLFDLETISNIKEGLNNIAEQVAIEILGEPKLRGGNFLKFGKNQGSLSVTVKGEKAGWWNDFSEGLGGRSVVSLLEKIGGMTKQQAFEYGAKRLGIFNRGEFTPLKTMSEKKEIDAQDIKNTQKKSDFFKKCIDQSMPIAGTIVERYLKENRQIKLDGISLDDLRFHPGIFAKLNGKTYPAMIAIARDEKGLATGIQVTYLNPKSSDRMRKPDVTIDKQSFGQIKGSSVNFQGKKGEPTFVAEGVETGLSVKNAFPDATVKVSLGKSNLKNVPHASKAEPFVLCLDQDGKEISKEREIRNLVLSAENKSQSVLLMIPESPKESKTNPLTPNKDFKIDYNDLLKSGGVEAIQDNFKQGITSSQFLKKPSAIETEKAIEMVAKHKSESMQKMISSYQKSNDLGSQKEIASQPLPQQKSKMNDLEFNI